MARRPSGQGWGESGGGVRLVEPDVEPWAARRRARSDGPSPRPPGRPGCRQAPARASHNDLQGRWPGDGPACAWRPSCRPAEPARKSCRPWSRTAVSGRRGGGPPHHAAVVQPLPFPTTKSSSSKPVKRSGLWWTRGLPPVEDRDRRGTTWRTGRRACGCRPWRPCVIRSPPPDPAWNLHTARGRAIDLHRWFT